MFSDFFARTNTFTLGVCNGCQMLSQIKSIIPGADHWPRFIQNESRQFEARTVMVKINPSPSIFFTDMQDSRLAVAVAHGEGKVAFTNPTHLDSALAKNLVAMTYTNDNYPFNPNGSEFGITGLTTLDGRVTIMMPHPERVFRKVQQTWRNQFDSQDDSAWMAMFYNAARWTK